MLKKIFFAAFVMTLLVAQNVSAQEVFVCAKDGYSYYVDEDTFINKTEYRDNRAFDVTVSIYRAAYHEKLLYSFWENDGLVWFSNGEGTGMHSVEGFEPAKRIWDFGLKFLNLDYEITYN